MDSQLIAQNFLNPPVLFFFLGLLAVMVKSDLEIPQPLAKFFSLYLLLSIGMEGGVHLQESGIKRETVLTLSAAMILAVAVPLYAFYVLKTRLDVYNATAIAATYGSISAVTFITAGAFLQRLGIEYSGYLVAAMALMESPAIIIAVVLVRRYAPARPDLSWKAIGRDAFLNGSVFLLVGSLCIGALTGGDGWEAVRPFTKDIFKGMLAFFLLDMGIVAAKRLHDLRHTGPFLIAFAILSPVVNAFTGMGIAALIGLSEGDAMMFTVLCGSASYIAVPAAMRLAVPEANPSLYVPMSLAITFPFNIIVGIPMYSAIINVLWR